ncbi:hypothetical protein HDU84_008278 [Entophlyctis sp. JEL0112]|nr:hypothetical protein HDU84_008278 [Entophlyctis sp. JEL0112]
MTRSATAASMNVSIKDPNGESGGNISRNISSVHLPSIGKGEDGTQVVPIPKRHLTSRLLLSSFSTAALAGNGGKETEVENAVAGFDSGLQSPDSPEACDMNDADDDYDHGGDAHAAQRQQQQQQQQHRLDEGLGRDYISPNWWWERPAAGAAAAADGEEEYDCNAGSEAQAADGSGSAEAFESGCGVAKLALHHAASKPGATAPTALRGRSQSLLVGEDFYHALYQISWRKQMYGRRRSLEQHLHINSLMYGLSACMSPSGAQRRDFWEP